ncbi:hypothetical protein LDENG_00120650 [Lucifuga dentata]|nr:hypothetical protein LDENG_00120650 [Lucifuga dentata]
MDSPAPRDDNPSERKKKDSSTDMEDLEMTEVEVSMFRSINNKLELLVELHKQMKKMQVSLNFAYEKIDRLESENKSLKVTMDLLTKKTNTLAKENKKTNETILDIQSRSMRDNLIFSGIPENLSSDDPEALLKDFMISKLKLPPDTVDSITFHHVHRLGDPKSKKPRPVIAKLEHYKHKDLIKRKARELKGSNFGINDQFPKEINNPWKILYPIMMQHRQNNKHAYMVVDKLYVDRQLYQNLSTTPWLF